MKSLLGILLLAVGTAGAQTQVTVYNQNFATVKRIVFWN
jgi:predicted porin